jgi:hypothetical protein
LKEWECIELGNLKDIGRTIMEWEKNGWKLHTYQAQRNPTFINPEYHYLLFERETEKSPVSVQVAATASV